MPFSKHLRAATKYYQPFLALYKKLYAVAASDQDIES